MDLDLILIDREQARSVLLAESICYSEGLAGASASLLAAIKKKWPELAEEFSWVPGLEQEKSA